MDERTQLEAERQRLEDELLTIERTIDEQQRHLKPEAADAQDEVIGLLKVSFDSHIARLGTVNARLAEMRGAAAQ